MGTVTNTKMHATYSPQSLDDLVQEISVVFLNNRRQGLVTPLTYLSLKLSQAIKTCIPAFYLHFCLTM